SSSSSKRKTSPSKKPLAFKKFQCKGFDDNISLHTCSAIKLAIEKRDCNLAELPNNYFAYFCEAAVAGLTFQDCQKASINFPGQVYLSACQGLQRALSKETCFGPWKHREIVSKNHSPPESV